MANELQPLSLLFQNRLFRIPDYQRGYAWLQQQLVDFWDDLVNLQTDRYHYTGLLSLKPLKSKETVSWGEDLWLVENGYKPCHIVDGQQRITTFVILLNEIVGFVRSLDENKNKSDKEITLGYETVEEIVSKYICRKRPPNGVVTTYLFGYEVDNPSAEYMKYKVFEEPYSGAISETYYTKNLKFAKNFFAENIRKLYEESGEGGLDAVNTLYKKLTQRLMFNLHEIDDDYDVFVAFETMNNRGKKLTNLELLKNRLIYLTTLYDDDVFDEKDKSALRKKINDAWKEVYYQLGRNKSVPLSDDDFLRAHWIIYFRYSRKRGDDYIKFLLSKFSSKGIFEKTPALVDAEAEQVISDDVTEVEDSETAEAEELETIEVSKLQPKEIEDYVNSLKDMAKYWYDTYFPFESVNLTADEQKRIDRLNRIGIGHFRPLVTAIISRRYISAGSRVKIFEAIERFIFVAFRLGNFNASYGSSDYYRAARQVYVKEKDVDELCREDQIESEFGESLNWEYSKPTGQTRSIVIEEKADDFNLAEQPKIFDWIIEHFDRITNALSLAGERLSLNGESSETRFEIRKRYWTYALVQIHEAHGNPGSFSNVNPSTDNWINGFFGIGGFYLCCVANFDSARSEVVFARTEKSENKAAFDALYQHKNEIESKLGKELQWNRGDDIKSSKVFIQIDNVSIENEDDWPQMAKFHAEWSKKFYDVIVPYISVAW